MLRLSLVVLILAFGARAGEAPRSKYTVSEVLRDVAPVLIGGVPADPEEFPASKYASMSGSRCSSTLVGPRVLIIAAHCVGNGRTASFSVGPNNFSAVCAHHPEYRNNSTADWALCLTDKTVSGVPFEVLATEAPYEVGDQLLLSGYGCVKPGGGGGNDGVFRIGKAKVTKLPSGKNYDTVTANGAALCYGDSGGSAWLLKEDGARLLVAINSRGNISTVSYLVSVWTESFKAWAEGWADKNNVRICGMHSDASGCRMKEPQEPVQFVVEAFNGEKSIKYEVTMKPGSPSTVQHSKKSFQDAADYLVSEAQ